MRGIPSILLRFSCEERTQPVLFQYWNTHYMRPYENSLNFNEVLPSGRFFNVCSIRSLTDGSCSRAEMAAEVVMFGWIIYTRCGWQRRWGFRRGLVHLDITFKVKCATLLHINHSDSVWCNVTMRIVSFFHRFILNNNGRASEHVCSAVYLLTKQRIAN